MYIYMHVYVCVFWILHHYVCVKTVKLEEVWIDNDNVVFKTYSPLRQSEESTQEEDMVIPNSPVSQDEDDYEQNSFEVNEKWNN